MVHAHGPESARRAVTAGCTGIEHGALLDTETSSLIADKGVYFDPNTYLVFHNYFENKARYLGVGNYTGEGFRQMEKAVPSVLQVFKTGLAMPKLKMVFGTEGRACARSDRRRSSSDRLPSGTGRVPSVQSVSRRGCGGRYLSRSAGSPSRW